MPGGGDGGGDGGAVCSGNAMVVIAGGSRASTATPSSTAIEAGVKVLSSCSSRERGWRRHSELG